jgi:hypothetical protein
VTLRALAMTGTPVLRMVVSSDSMKKATATSQGRRFRVEEVRTSARGTGRVGWDGCMGENISPIRAESRSPDVRTEADLENKWSERHFQDTVKLWSV